MVLRRQLVVARDPELDRPLHAHDVADGGTDQAEEVPLDPVARELVRNREDEGVALELEAVDVTEPFGIGPVAERFLESPRDLLPEVLCRQLELVLHRRPAPPVADPAASITAVPIGTK